MRTFATDDPLVWARTEGSCVWDEDGRRFLDLHGGFAAASVGYCHPRVTEAICRQAETMTHCPSAFLSRARADLYERLVDLAPEGLERVLLAATGSLANETAVQLARAATGRHAVVTFSGTYVGRSLGAVRYAGKHAYRSALGVTSGAHFVPYPDPYRSPWPEGEASAGALALLEQMLSDPASGVDPAACVLVEPVQGNAGAIVPEDGFLRGLRRLCDEHGALLVFDEIQCGFGRTGRTWACEHEGVVPDLMTVGKGVGGGLALAAILGRDEYMRTWEADAVSSTFLANALTGAAACAAIDVLREEGLAERAAVLGEGALHRLRADLGEHAHVGDVRGRGLLIGLELVRDRNGRQPDPERAREVVSALREGGVLAGRGGRHGNVIKLAPPLVISEEELEAGLDRIMEVLVDHGSP
jgi:4-aminobutyrate aminotransferase-like enzyme